MMKTFQYSFLSLLLFMQMVCAFSQKVKTVQGGLELPMTYGNHMVLQRGTVIRFHGKAPAGAFVTIALDNGQKPLQQKVRAGKGGYWMAVFPAQQAGGPYTLSFTAGKEKQAFTDVWVGEVWLCSGQSNMELPLSSIVTAKADLAAADTLNRVHLLNMPSPWPVYAQVWSKALIDSVDNGLLHQTGRWERCSKESARNFSAIGFHFGRILADSLKCHIGLINNAVGGATTEGWIDSTSLAREVPEILQGDWRKNPNIMEWARHRADYNLKNADPRRPHLHPYAPTFLFNAALRPLQSYALRGVLWYQGESNADLPRMHERLFPLLERSWRKELRNPRLPFLTVQLSGISTRPVWPEFRNSQRLLADSLPNTWMTVSSDLGDSLDVHPRRKAPIGERLAASALHHVYGHKQVVPCGPKPLRATAVGSALSISFAYAEGMRAADGRSIKGFELAGEDGKFSPATKVEANGNTLRVKSDTVAQPRWVRYAWEAFPHANLVNGRDMPCSTFVLDVEREQ